MNTKAGPLVTAIQFVCLFLFGTFTFLNVESFKAHVVPHAVSASKLETDVGVALSSKSNSDKIKAYKVVKGIAEYCRNSERTMKNKKVRDMIIEVYNVYKTEDFTEFNKIIDSESIAAGLKPDADLSISKTELAKVYDRIADIVKSSIHLDKVK